LRCVCRIARRWGIAFCTLTSFFTLILYPVLVLWRVLAGRRPKPSRYAAPPSATCQTIPPHIYNRPDPMIYSQRYLQSQGLAVTWNNPDVTITQGGVAVDPYSLDPNTAYQVTARVWNGSTNAPAVGLPVRFSYLSFGIGTQTHPIATTTVNLGAKGAPNCPTFAEVTWTTPAIAGHYCLLIELLWSDDANPFNNVGQSNTNVRKLNSPHATFEFDAANPAGERHVYRFSVDAYTPGTRPSCSDLPRAPFPTPSAQELRAHIERTRRENAPSAFPVPAGWTIVVDPQELALGPGDTRAVTVDITAPDGFSGSQAFNVNGFDERGRLVGGVTLTAES
jgi:hypothetical protein